MCGMWGVYLTMVLMYQWTKEARWFLTIWFMLLSAFLTLFDGVPWGGVKCVLECSMVAVDLGSYLFILLSAWLGGMVLLISMRGVLHKDVNSGLYLLSLTSLTFILSLCFMSSDVLWFYVFYEASLIPISVLILSWGDQPERLDAARYMVCYTIMCSAPLFFGFMSLSVKYGSFFMWFVMFKPMLPSLMWVILSLGLLVKLPIFPLHVWLPKAHVEAPVGGSLLLAGVLLKMGGYGLFRVMMAYGYVIEKFGYVVISFCFWGGVYTSMLCIRQVDVKALIAYSSVGHMGVACAGIYTSTEMGWNASMGLMIVHAFVSCGLFTLASYGYEVVKSRSIFLMKGLCSIYPSMSAFWFLFCFLNMGCPPSLGVLSEIMISGVMISMGGFLALLPIVVLLFFGGGYNLYLYSETQHGASMEGGYVSKYNVSDYNGLIGFLFWSLVLVFKGGLIVGWVF
uniref:NADH-ubiquinone oxidoreductase chain 4 n=1 Tax=Atrina pectinata TaxID=49198 RepID=L0ETL6_ATRPE|nr:NADH dehydrogenase subunit 4 [Atrina pectinata]AGA63952.1 NADH dehydrogenase subunit 4 [Atrina pectinata]UZT27159.1 NADH dehydrogenase subunit 4 [Atrina pectinata]